MSFDEDMASEKRSPAILRTSMDISYPPHEERSKDPYLPVFLATRKYLLEEKKDVCWRCGGGENLEAHHRIQWVFFSDIDIEKLRADFPSFTGITEDDKLRWLNGPDNIMILCKDCHTETHGIHKIPYPLWVIRRYINDVSIDTVIINERARIRRAVRSTAEETARQPIVKNLHISPRLQRLMRRT